MIKTFTDEEGKEWGAEFKDKTLNDCLIIRPIEPIKAVEDLGASATPDKAKQPSVSKSVTVEEAYRRGVIDATGGLAIPNLMNHQKSRNTAFKKYAIKFFNTKIKERRERLLGNTVNDLATSNLACNSGVSNPQQIAQEANKARLDELQRVLIMASTPKTRTSASIRRVVKSWIVFLNEDLTADKEQADG